MSAPPNHFHYCPSCGEALEPIKDKALTCAACGFTYFFNPTIGLAGFIQNKSGQVLLIERGREPSKGKLAPPGGFADVDETAEAALSREVFEETGLQVTDWTYLCSAVNHYAYKEVTYPVLDFFFTATVVGNPVLKPCGDETKGAKWVEVSSIDAASLAFPSMQRAFRQFVGML